MQEGLFQWTTLTGPDWCGVPTDWTDCNMELLAGLRWWRDNAVRFCSRLPVCFTERSWRRFLCTADTLSARFDDQQLFCREPLTPFVHSGVKIFVGIRWRTGLSDLQCNIQQNHGQHSWLIKMRRKKTIWVFNMSITWWLIHNTYLQLQSDITTHELQLIRAFHTQ